MLNIATEVPQHIRGAFNVGALDPRVSSQINEIGPIEFWSLLNRLLPSAEGTLSFMRPGKVRCFVFRVNAKFAEGDKSPTRPKSWIVKVSSRVAELETELTNYSEMGKTPLPRTFYPKIFGEGLTRVGSLGGFVLDPEEGASSLMEIFRDLSEKEAEDVLGGVGVFESYVWRFKEKNKKREELLLVG